MGVSLPPHNVLSPFHLDTLTASVVRGSLIIGNSTPKWAIATPTVAGSIPAFDGTDTAFTRTLASGTITVSDPFTNTQTWNAVGVTFIGSTTNITSTASAAGSLIERWQTGGVNMLSIRKDGYLAVNAGTSEFAIETALGGYQTKFYVAGGLAVTLDGINVTSNGTGAAFGWNGDVWLKRVAAASVQFGFDVNGAAVAQTLSACNGITGTDTTGGNFTIASGKGTGAGAVSSLIFQTPTVLTTGTTAQTLTTRLTISSASVTSPLSLIARNATAIPAGGTAGAGFTFSSTANFGTFFGSGAPSLTAAKGSLYLRSDGASNVTRAYINTDGGTTWTAINTVA